MLSFATGQVRRATESDRATICQLAARKVLPDHPVAGLSGRQLAEWTAQQYRDNWAGLLARPDMVILACQQPSGYAMAILGDRESLTGERQLHIADYCGDLGTFLQPLLALAGQDGSTHLVTRVLEGQAHNLDLLGFRPEISRLLARIQGRPNASAFEVRRAAARDRFFLANLHRQGGPFYVPAHRQINQDEMSFRNMTLYLGLDLGQGSNMTGYVISDGNRPFGYVLFKLGLSLPVSGAPLVYLYDIQLQKEYWGRSAARILLRQAMLDLQHQGLEWIAGDVSCANASVHHLAMRAANFKPEWTRWGRSQSE
ncbi:hypothetical protein IV102_26030 [bacterium]|nr:hypothetical protein [bacterium]